MKRKATAPGHVWSWDFIMDRTTDGRPVKMLTMVDEYTRQCLIIHPARSITSDQVLDILEYLAEAWGAPAFIRSDNGSEFIAQIIQDWCHTPGSKPFISSRGAHGKMDSSKVFIAAFETSA